MAMGQGNMNGRRGKRWTGQAGVASMSLLALGVLLFLLWGQRAVVVKRAGGSVEDQVLRVAIEMSGVSSAMTILKSVAVINKPDKPQMFITSEDFPVEEQNHGRRHADADGPPFFRRLCILIVLFFGGFLLSLRGWENLDDDRRLRSAALICGGLLLNGAGIALWLATLAWPRTWAWWL